MGFHNEQVLDAGSRPASAPQLHDVVQVRPLERPAGLGAKAGDQQANDDGMPTILAVLLRALSAWPA